jgi:hypothetical protein
VIEPPVADAPATILHPNITGVDLIVLSEPLCPVTGELAACSAGKTRYIRLKRSGQPDDGRWPVTGPYQAALVRLALP